MRCPRRSMMPCAGIWMRTVSATAASSAGSANEADVNGQLLVGHYYASVFKVLHYPVVPLCTEEDGENFVEMICTRQA